MYDYRKKNKLLPKSKNLLNHENAKLLLSNGNKKKYQCIPHAYYEKITIII